VRIVAVGVLASCAACATDADGSQSPCLEGECAPPVHGKADAVGFDWSLKMYDGDIPPFHAYVHLPVRFHELTVQEGGEHVYHTSPLVWGRPANYDSWVSCFVGARAPGTINRKGPFRIERVSVKQWYFERSYKFELVPNPEGLRYLLCVKDNGKPDMTYDEVRNMFAQPNSGTLVGFEELPVAGDHGPRFYTSSRVSLPEAAFDCARVGYRIASLEESQALFEEHLAAFEPGSCLWGPDDGDGRASTYVVGGAMGSDISSARTDERACFAMCVSP
jgi:hypothetical protein